MEDFPEFMKSAANKIATNSQSTPGVEGYLYDGVDGNQMAFWTCRLPIPLHTCTITTSTCWSSKAAIP